MTGYNHSMQAPTYPGAPMQQSYPAFNNNNGSSAPPAMPFPSLQFPMGNAGGGLSMPQQQQPRAGPGASAPPAAAKKDAFAGLADLSLASKPKSKP